MTIPNFIGAMNYALSRLENELPQTFFYHSLKHTRDDVIIASRKLGEISGLDEREIHLLEIAAAFHDLGFLYLITGHEQKGADLVRELLPGYGFNQNDTNRVANMILATRLPQSPQDFLEEILADADLDVLGREDFLARNELLRQELAVLGRYFTDEEWYTSQLRFLENHTFFSEAARALRNEGKYQNILLMRQKIEAGRSEIRN